MRIMDSHHFTSETGDGAKLDGNIFATLTAIMSLKLWVLSPPKSYGVWVVRGLWVFTPNHHCPKSGRPKSYGFSEVMGFDVYGIRGSRL